MNLIRSNQIPDEELQGAAASSQHADRSTAFVDLCLVVRDEYERLLARASKIDFATMIQQATRVLESSPSDSKYSHVLVDGTSTRSLC